MVQPLLSVEGLRVEYEPVTEGENAYAAAPVTAVDDVSFSIEPGVVYGLIGPNGAGKTSIIKAVAHVLEPTYGRIRVAGIDLMDDPSAALARIGYMPDFPPLYEDLTVHEFLELFASAYRLPAETRRPRIAALLDKVSLTAKRDSLTGGLSRGMKQRLFLAKTLLHDPDVLLLDEPASGLDPRARLELRDVIVELGRRGKAVLVSSHILAEMADFCSAVGIMEQGRMLVSGPIQEILQRLRPGLTVQLRLLRADDRLGGFLAARPGISRIAVDGANAVFQLDGDEAMACALLKSMVEAGFPVTAFYEQSGNLQDIFLEMSTGRVV